MAAISFKWFSVLRHHLKKKMWRNISGFESFLNWKLERGLFKIVALPCFRRCRQNFKLKRDLPLLLPPTHPSLSHSLTHSLSHSHLPSFNKFLFQDTKSNFIFSIEEEKESPILNLLKFCWYRNVWIGNLISAKMSAAAKAKAKKKYWKNMVPDLQEPRLAVQNLIDQLIVPLK